MVELESFLVSLTTGFYLWSDTPPMSRELIVLGIKTPAKWLNFEMQVLIQKHLFFQTQLHLLFWCGSKHPGSAISKSLISSNWKEVQSRSYFFRQGGTEMID